MEKDVETPRIIVKTPTISTEPPQKTNLNILAPLASFSVSDTVETSWNPVDNKVLNWAGWPDLLAPGEHFHVVLPRRHTLVSCGGE